LAGWNRFPCGGHANFTASHPVWLITGREPSKPNTVDDFWSHPSDKHYSISVASTQVGQNKNMKCRECLINNRAWVAVENLRAKARFGRGARPVERIDSRASLASMLGIRDTGQDAHQGVAHSGRFITSPGDSPPFSRNTTFRLKSHTAHHNAGSVPERNAHNNNYCPDLQGTEHGRLFLLVQVDAGTDSAWGKQ